MADPGTLKPSFGVTGLSSVPRGQKYRTGGPELHDEELLGTLEANGSRLAWSRASICPCAGFNDQTRQPDPTCSRCDGGAVFYFGPKDYAPSKEVGELTDLQKAILAEDGAAVITGVIQRVTHAQDFYDILGNWVRGTMLVTVRPENKIGYYDRLVNLDSEVATSQIVLAGDPTADLELRYPATVVNTIVSDDASGGVRYEQGTEFVTVAGKIRWYAALAPAAGTRLSVHYLMHPTWLVVDHPHVLREIKRRRDGKPKKTPGGNPTALPLQAAVRLEFLPRTEIPPPPAP